MAERTRALVISDLPIFGSTVQRVLDDEWEVVMQDWFAFARTPLHRAQLVILDLTEMYREAALAMLRHRVDSGWVVICSLHRNEVEVYKLDSAGMVDEGILPSLLSLGDLPVQA